MTDITKSQYVSRINSRLRVPAASKGPGVSGTDKTRATTWGSDNKSPPLTLQDPAATDVAAVDGDLPGTDVKGEDVRDLMIAKATDWSYVRKIRYVYDGDTPPAGQTYDRYAYVPVGHRDPAGSSSIPEATGTGSGIYDILLAGTDIDLSDFYALVENLRTKIIADNNVLEHTVTYCHSQCHTQCHTSRGRR